MSPLLDSPSSDANDTDTHMRVCKICLQKDDCANLISPCLCKGTMKYVHAECIASWRMALFRSNRGGELYSCSVCKFPYQVHQHRRWVSLLRYRLVRVLATVILLALLLVPAGALMKVLIHFSVRLVNYRGGLRHSMAMGSITDLFSSPDPASLSQQVIYTPFPVCHLPASTLHSLFSNQLVYYLLFPFSDDRLWRLILCRLQHFHLGFFLLGSINNIWFTYKILSDMFDIVLALDRPAPAAPDGGVPTTNRMARLFKGFLLMYCCSLVVLFWIHFNLFAFHVDASKEASVFAGDDAQKFLAELPLWALRWVTLGVAVVEFAARGIYVWLERATTWVDGEEVLSIDNQ